MKIITTTAGHVIERAERARPFQVCIGGRMRSFATLSAAVAAKTAATTESREFAKEISDSQIRAGRGE